MSLQDYLLGQAVKALLLYKSRPGAIERALRHLAYPRALPPEPGRVTVAVVQMEFELLNDGVQFAKKVYGLARPAVEQGAQLIVFPEYAWTPLLGLLPVVRDLARKGLTLEGAVAELAPGGDLTLAGVFRTMAPATRRVFETTGRVLAERLGVYLMMGSAVVADASGHLFNTAYLFSPDGTLRTQKKLHPFLAMEGDWLTVGESLEVFELPFGRLAMPVCMDHTFWETARVAELKGADLLLDFSADPTGDHVYLAARGVRARVQESRVYGTAAFMVSDLFGLHWRGPSFICAPIEWAGTSIMAQAQTADREEVIVAELDLAQAREWRAARPRDFNVALYEKCFPHVYTAYRARRTREGKRVVK